jgi:hypothetical protein
LQEHSASGGRRHRKNHDHWRHDEGLFILTLGGSGYLPRTQLRARGMSQGFFRQLC